MRRSRPTGAILALGRLVTAARGRALPVAGLLVLAPLVGSAPASAHPGATVFQVGLGVATPIDILVPADYGLPITEVDITAAAGFRLDGGDPPAHSGWRLARSRDTLVFTGDTIPADSPGPLFTVRGAATAKGMLVFPITTHSPDGTVMRYTGGPTSADAGAVVYAGVTPHIPGAGRGFPWKTVGGGLMIGVGVAGTAGLVAQRRRRPAG